MRPAPPEPPLRGQRKGGAGAAVLAVTAVLFVALWGTVLVGHRTLIGGDILYNFSPWAAEPHAHAPRNVYIGDPVTQFVPWMGLVKEAFGDRKLPLWNPYSLSGTPLLANDQSSPFSPFTLFALLFAPARGISLAMLLKLWVAGLGMAVFIRLHGARTLAAAVAGIAYATSSFVVLWLAYPHTAVASMMPWAFAATAWYLKTRRPLAVAALAAAIALQFLGGHAETSLHLGAALAIYAAVRLVGLPTGRLRALGGLTAGIALGGLLAGAQLVPFMGNLSETSLWRDRAHSDTGSVHLPWKQVTTWVMPNDSGSPGLDGEASRFPVYPESTGYAGTGALVLAGWATLRVRRRDRLFWEKVALLAVGAATAGVVYGQLSSLAGKVPMLAVSNNVRFLVCICFAVAALAGLGLDDLLQGSDERARAHHRSRAGRGAAALAALALAGLAAAAAVVLLRPHRPLTLLPEVRGRAGFWVVTGLLGLVAALALLVATRAATRAPGVAAGFVVLALIEAVLFAYPYNPRVPASEVPPQSTVVDWLRDRRPDTMVAGVGDALIPNMSVTVPAGDPRGVDTLVNHRVRRFWRRADSGFHDEYLYTFLEKPDAGWLAAAGVGYLITPADRVTPGTTPVFTYKTVTVSEVPGVRPFAFAAPTAVAAADDEAAARAIGQDPLRVVAVEGRGEPPSGPADVTIRRRSARVVTLDVEASAPATIVVLQTYEAGWHARVDGQEAKIRPANILFQSVTVPAGSHTVTLRYEPETLKLGMAATASGLLGLCLMGLASVRRRRDRGEARRLEDALGRLPRKVVIAEGTPREVVADERPAGVLDVVSR